MKKNNKVLIILFCLFFIPYIVKAETCEIDKIKLDSITIDNKSDNIAELDTATINNKNINLNLSTNNPTNIQDLLKNPKTGNLYLLIIVLLFIITLLPFLKKIKHNKYIILILGTTIIIPIYVQALCKCDIEIESKIRIDKPVEEDVLYLYGRIYNVSIGDSINITKIEDQNLIEQYGDTLYAVGESGLSTDKDLMFNIFSRDPVFFKYKIKDNIIKEISIEYLFNNIQYSLVYNPSNYESNKQVLKDSFGENNCFSHNNDNYYYCQIGITGGNANINGDIDIFINNFSCYISQNKTYCSAD